MTKNEIYSTIDGMLEDIFDRNPSYNGPSKMETCIIKLCKIIKDLTEQLDTQKYLMNNVWIQFLKNAIDETANNYEFDMNYNDAGAMSKSIENMESDYKQMASEGNLELPIGENGEMVKVKDISMTSWPDEENPQILHCSISVTPDIESIVGDCREED